MKTYLKTGLTLVGKGLLELMHVIFILSIGVITYYLVRNLPIDDMLAMAFSIVAVLVTAHRIYRSSGLSLVESTNNEKVHKINFDDMNPAYSLDAENIYFNEDKSN